VQIDQYLKQKKEGLALAMLLALWNPEDFRSKPDLGAAGKGLPRAGELASLYAAPRHRVYCMQH
jgi:hypothetical protein